MASVSNAVHQGDPTSVCVSCGVWSTLVVKLNWRLAIRPLSSAKLATYAALDIHVICASSGKGCACPNPFETLLTSRGESFEETGRALPCVDSFLCGKCEEDWDGMLLFLKKHHRYKGAWMRGHTRWLSRHNKVKEHYESCVEQRKKVNCFVCAHASEGKSQIERLVAPLFLERVRMGKRRERFLHLIKEKTGLSREFGAVLLDKRWGLKLCNTHINTCRHVIYGLDEQAIESCSVPGCVSKPGKTLRKLTEPVDDQKRDEMCDIVHVLSNGALEFRDIVGKYVCSSCRYVIERRSDKTTSQPSLALVPHASIRDLFHEVLDIIDASASKTINFATVEKVYHDICMSRRENEHENRQFDVPVSSRTLKFYLCPLLQTREISLRRQAGRGHKLFSL